MTEILNRIYADSSAGRPWPASEAAVVVRSLIGGTDSTGKKEGYIAILREALDVIEAIPVCETEDCGALAIPGNGPAGLCVLCGQRRSVNVGREVDWRLGVKGASRPTIPIVLSPEENDRVERILEARKRRAAKDLQKEDAAHA